jgi:pimeloyl-ACP methyl ester carboxylesterase
MHAASASPGIDSAPGVALFEDKARGRQENSMTNSVPAAYPLRHRHVEAEGVPMHIVEAGNPANPAVLFVHGWPESWAAFDQLMHLMSNKAHVVTMDLPGIGASPAPPRSGDKRTLARYVHGVINALGLKEVTLVGHDIGGMIVYAYLRSYPSQLKGAVIMNVAIPGVDPWEEIKHNPAVWHFGFHAVPELPEKLVTGKQKDYFAFFYDRLSAAPGGVSPTAREAYVDAYSRPEALRAGFDWYRGFPQDEKDNDAVKNEIVDTPLLYLRGEKDVGQGLHEYISGLRAAGMRDVQGGVINGSGHFSPDERPDEVARALENFLVLENA